MYQGAMEGVVDDRLVFAVFIAAAAHVLLILGLGFEAYPTREYGKQLKITLATSPQTEAPDKAQHIAQSNQLGSGSNAPEDRVTSPMNSPLSKDQVNQPQMPNQASPDAIARRSTILSTTTAMPNQVAQNLDNPAEQKMPLKGLDPEVDRLSRELATLEAEFDEQTRAYANRPRVRRVTAVSARQSSDAAYLNDWRRRVEAVGNKYYPEASLRYGIYGDLRLLVIVRSDGSLENIRVLSSSGYAVLDEAAMKIVRLAAPFSPFPEELKATTDKLEIIRTWQFQENRLSSN